MAEVVLRHLLETAGLSERVEVSSAGTGPWHEGEPMDPRARAALADAGFADHGHIAHQFDPTRGADLDLVVGLDRRHRQTIESLAGAQLEGRLVLLRSFERAGGGEVDVPDPYYGDDADFARCLGLIETASRGLAASLVDLLAAPGPEAPRPGPGLAGPR